MIDFLLVTCVDDTKCLVSMSKIAYISEDTGVTCIHIGYQNTIIKVKEAVADITETIRTLYN